MSLIRAGRILFSLILGVLVMSMAAACSGAQPPQPATPGAGEAPVAYPGAPPVIPTLDPYPAPSGQPGGTKSTLTRSDWTPLARDQNYTRGEADIQESGILPSTEDAQVSALYISGNLPTPCHMLRVVVSGPDPQDVIHVDVYTVADPNEMCTQVLEPFSAEVPLPGYVEGKTTLLVNGEPLP
jgi:hypothetical protein